MRRVCIFSIGIFLLSTSFNSQDKYSIEVEILNCEYQRKYGDWVYLLKDGKKIDSIDTYQYKDYFIFQFWKRNNRFKFKSLAPGDYQIKYKPRFKFDSLATVEIENRDEKIKICFDEVPPKAYKRTTIMDKLSVRDTLFINGYVAAGGEFGGYDEGLWLWIKGNQLKGQFYRLANTYGMGWDESRIAFYNQNKSNAMAISEEFILSEEQQQIVRKFLIETRNYNEERGLSNAPEFITVYSRDDRFQIIEHDFDWKPFLKLKEKLRLPTQ